MFRVRAREVNNRYSFLFYSEIITKPGFDEYYISMKYFGTDGIRKDYRFFDREFLAKVACGIVKHAEVACVCLGRDTRNSGVYIEAVLTEELIKRGVDVIRTGVITSPGLAVVACKLKCDCAVMISASHNPPNYNGIKVFDRYGRKISAQAERAIERYIDNPFGERKPFGKEFFIDGRNIYTDFIVSAAKINIKDMKVMLDCGYGGASHFAKDVFEACGASVYSINDAYAGEKINVSCGVMDMNNLLSRMSGEFDLGFSFDGDGDRTIAARKGKIYDGDRLLFVNALEKKSKGVLRSNGVAGTVMTNMGAERAYNKNGIRLYRADVGDRNVFRVILDNLLCLGGEKSGHIIFNDFLNTGDGILTALITCTLHQEKPLEEREDFTSVPESDRTISVSEAGKEYFNSSLLNGSLTLPYFKDARTVVRGSGTENKIRIHTESDDATRGAEACDSIAEIIEEFLREYL